MWFQRQQQFVWRLLLLLAVLVACTENGGQGPAAQTVPGPQAASASPTPFSLPTLLPTQTRLAAPTEAPASPVALTATPQSTVDFEQPVVNIRYRIPALQLDRRLEGNVSGQVTVVDETRGVAAIRQNQGGVLLELQEILPSLDLQAVPEGCDTCVAFSYSMPLAGAEGEGWLQDPVLLASVENYTAALVGPHFPPGTVMGLRRSATAYDVAHSLALDAEGVLYRWLATAGEIGEPVAVETVAPELPALVSAVDREALSEEYVVSCMSAPLETLYFQEEGAVIEEEEGLAVRVSCPAFSLPRSLLPLYLQLDALLGEVLEGSGLPRPPSDVALDTVLDYQREDGTRLEIALGGMARITDDAGETVTTTISSEDVISVTTALLDSGIMMPGLEAFVSGESPNLLLVRGEEGMLEAAWPAGSVPQEIEQEVRVLDEMAATEE